MFTISIARFKSFGEIGLARKSPFISVVWVVTNFIIPESTIDMLLLCLVSVWLRLVKCFNALPLDGTHIILKYARRSLIHAEFQKHIREPYSQFDSFIKCSILSLSRVETQKVYKFFVAAITASRYLISVSKRLRLLFLK